MKTAPALLAVALAIGTGGCADSAADRRLERLRGTIGEPVYFVGKRFKGVGLSDVWIFPRVHSAFAIYCRCRRSDSSRYFDVVTTDFSEITVRTETSGGCVWLRNPRLSSAFDVREGVIVLAGQKIVEIRGEFKDAEKRRVLALVRDARHPARPVPAADRVNQAFVSAYCES